mmetsp:Transcript_51083/g.119583  ORF Transcript_51083/g.119583 Transcript_51083/m.119583 type:complete len:301 (-) Transcript_51083:18-920(-)
MTSLDKDGIAVNSIGRQAQSSRKTEPSFSLSRCGRHHREAMFISKDHTRTATIGRAGASMTYVVPSTLSSHAVAFPKSVRKEEKPNFADGVSTNDELCININSAPFKFRRDPTIMIGTDARGKMNDAALLKNHSAAFFGRASPGPAAFRPDDSATRSSLGKATVFGSKPKDKSNYIGDTPPNVAPGIYERKDDSVGPQALSQRKNHPSHRFPQAAKFPKGTNADTIVNLDNARSSMGKQVLGKNKSETSVGMAKGTRDARSRSALCQTNLDMGPKASLPKQNFALPTLPKESEIMKWGYG